MTLWITSRAAVVVSYKAYLLLKVTCQKIGKSYLDEIVKVASAEARVNGVKGTSITNMNLSDMYEAQWVAIYGDTPAISAALDATNPYKSLVPIDQNVTGTGSYALWLQAKAATAVASAAHATAKTAWNDQKTAVSAQNAVKTLAIAEKAATATASGVSAGLATTALNAYNTASTASTNADSAYTTANGLYTTATNEATTAASNSSAAYAALVTLRATADGKVDAT